MDSSCPPCRETQSWSFPAQSWGKGWWEAGVALAPHPKVCVWGWGEAWWVCEEGSGWGQGSSPPPHWCSTSCFSFSAWLFGAKSWCIHTAPSDVNVCCAFPQSWDGNLAPWAIDYPGHIFALSSPCAGEVHKVTQERWSCSAKMKLWGFSTSSFFLAQLGLQQAEWLAQPCNSSAVCLQPFLNLPLPPGPHDQLILHPWGELALCSFGLLTF